MAAPWTHDDKNEMKDPINLKFRNSELSDIDRILRADGWGPPFLFWGDQSLRTNTFTCLIVNKYKIPSFVNRL